jgi:hypothetical protein
MVSPCRMLHLAAISSAVAYPKRAFTGERAISLIPVGCTAHPDGIHSFACRLLILRFQPSLVASDFRLSLAADARTANYVSGLSTRNVHECCDLHRFVLATNDPTGKHGILQRMLRLVATKRMHRQPAQMQSYSNIHPIASHRT